MQTAKLLESLRNAALALSLAMVSLAAPAADSTWTSVADGNWMTPGNWSGDGTPCGDMAGSTFTGTAFFTNPGTQHSTFIPSVCVLNRIVFGASSGWVVDSIYPMQLASGFLGLTPSIQADVDATINSGIGFNTNFVISGAGNLTFTNTDYGLDGFGSLTLNGPGTTTIASHLDTNTSDPSPVIVNGGTLVTSPLTGSHDLTIAAAASVVTSAAAWRSIAGSGTLTLGSGMTSIAIPSTFSGNVAGIGTLQTKFGTVALTGTGNTWSGGAVIDPGSTLHFGAVGSVPATGTFTNQGTLSVDIPGPPSTLAALFGGGQLLLTNGTLNIGNPSLPTGPVVLNGGILNAPSMTLTGGVTIAPGALLNKNGGSVGSLSGSGTLTLTGFVAVGDNNASTTFAGSITNSGGGTLQKVGGGTLTLTGSAVPNIQVFQGTLRLQSPSFIGGILSVQSGGTLSGSFTASVPVQVISGGTFAPDLASTASLNSSGTLVFGIGGTTPGSGHSQVTVANAPTLTSSTLVLTGSYVPAAGDTFVLINNSGGGAPIGTFTGLPEGATITFNGIALRISYVGGTGANDVVLTVGTKQVSPSVVGNGLMNPSTPQTVAEGATATFSLLAAAFHHLASIGGTCPAGALPPGATYTTGVITGDCSVIANFVIDSYSVTPSQGANGTITPNSVQTVNRNSTQTFTITPSTGYTASIGGTCPTTIYNGGPSYTTGAITANCTVVVSFAPIVYTVTSSAGANGAIALLGPQPVNHGSTLQFTITPATGYTASIGGTCPLNATPYTGGSSYTTAPITANCTVIASFTLSQYTVTASAGPNGTISPSGAVSAVNHGSTQAFTITPATGYTASIGGTCPLNATPYTGGPSYTTGPITGNCTVVASFTINQYTVTPTAGAHGSISPSTPQTVAHGATATFVATPSAGYSTLSITGCGGTFSHANPGYTTAPITANCTVSATFVSLGSDLGTTITASPTTAVVGQDVTFTLTLSSSGPEVGTDIGAWIVVPAGATFVSATDGCSPMTLGQQNIVACFLDTLAIGATRSFTFVLKPTVTGTLTVTGDVSSGTYPDPVAGNEESSVSVTVASPPRLVNISTRTQVLTGDNVMIGGLIVGGPVNKTVVIRARGPSMVPTGVTNPLVNPRLDLYSGQTVIASSDDWGGNANAAAVTASGFAPPEAAEGAILINLAPGPYTAIVSGVGGTTGVGLVEVFEVDHPEVPLINIATRGRVQTGLEVMIAGFIIQGSGQQSVVVRARGPSLTATGVPDVLANPTLTLVRSSDGTIIAANDDWQTAANAAALLASGFAPADPKEAAILISLDPGAYTAIVRGAGETSGVAIVEVFRN